MKKLGFDDPASVLGVIFWIAGSALVMLSPTWIYLVVHMVLQPTGFWQKFVLIGVGAYFLGALQLVMLVGGITIIYNLWTDHRTARHRKNEQKKLTQGDI